MDLLLYLLMHLGIFISIAIILHFNERIKIKSNEFILFIATYTLLMCVGANAFILQKNIFNLNFQYGWLSQSAMLLCAVFIVVILKKHYKIEGWHEFGLTLKQNKIPIYPILTLIIFIAILSALTIALNDNRSFQIPIGKSEAVIFQATLPGLCEEIVYRSLYMFILLKAFSSREHSKNIKWVCFCLSFLFALDHVLFFNNGVIKFSSFFEEMQTFVIVFIIALILNWARVISGSVVFPIIMHNITNICFLFLP